MDAQPKESIRRGSEDVYSVQMGDADMCMCMLCDERDGAVWLCRARGRCVQCGAAPLCSPLRWHNRVQVRVD